MPTFLRPIDSSTTSSEQPLAPSPRAKLEIGFRHIQDRSGRLRAMAERELALLTSIDRSIGHVRVTVERLQKHASADARYRARVNVQLPGRVLVGGRPRGGGEYADPQAAMADAFRSLRHQLRGSRRRRKRGRRRA